MGRSPFLCSKDPHFWSVRGVRHTTEQIVAVRARCWTHRRGVRHTAEQIVSKIVVISPFLWGYPTPNGLATRRARPGLWSTHISRETEALEAHAAPQWVEEIQAPLFDQSPLLDRGNVLNGPEHQF